IFLFIYDPPSSPPCSFLSVLTFLGEAMNQEIQNLTVRPGGSVTLQTGLSGLNGEHILWMYGSNKMLLFCDERDISGPPEEYAGRLQLNQSSGCLTISNIRKTAGGGLSSTRERFGTGEVHRAKAPLPVESKTDTGGQPVTDGICFVRCSVKNSPNVTLSWYRGEEEINQTKNPDISIHLTLPLTIQRQNEAIYTCKAENPVSSETATLNSTLRTLKKDSIFLKWILQVGEP
uniref:Ig-like domain-containing protein n=1 Tax=Astatotilapia calliptera TaxID=8154 RepID=A0AAX7T012_ASTCA